MHSSNKDIGNLGESVAESYLVEVGYVILEKNFRCKTGEIDLIGKDGDFIVFIEVKARYGSLYGLPRESVNIIKQHKIIKTAEMYILRKKLLNFNFRFDVLEVILNTNNNNHSITLIKNAFQT